MTYCKAILLTGYMIWAELVTTFFFRVPPKFHIKELKLYALKNALGRAVKLILVRELD